MSFSRLPYDDGSYTQTLKQSIGPGQYQVDMPRNDCDGCFPLDRNVDRFGGGLYKSLVDVDSELIGITRRSSHCPAEKYLPTDNDKKFGAKSELKECRWLTPESTLISNPKCTNHERTINRWEWLCVDLQKNALVPFDYLISDRIITRDSHRPCIPKPIDQCAACPPECNNDIVYDWSSAWQKENMFPLSTPAAPCYNIKKQ